jgi:hypothetical protein
MFCIDDTKDSDATNTHGQQQKESGGDDLISMAYSDINRAKSLEDLTAVYNNYTSLHTNGNFMKALTARKTAIKSGL